MGTITTSNTWVCQKQIKLNGSNLSVRMCQSCQQRSKFADLDPRFWKLGTMVGAKEALRQYLINPTQTPDSSCERKGTGKDIGTAERPWSKIEQGKRQACNRSQK
uniref:Uncharacterized protein n=1 Tax=Opuntia streptacantha TaxID=393608 RepID=A0A7C9CSH4_OPUST